MGFGIGPNPHTEDDENYIFFMELCDTSLQKLLAKKKKFTPSEILYIMEGLNKVFKYMVNNNIIHRYIKPDNILIKYIDDSKTKFIPKICDYGISRELEDGIATTNAGTAEFKAPEVMDKEYDKYNNKSDLFSIGVMMHWLLFYEYHPQSPLNLNSYLNLTILLLLNYNFIIIFNRFQFK